ncbi:MAG: hypothetical protein ABI885_23955 [Gammaproteobacteria bacterium]
MATDVSLPSVVLFVEGTGKVEVFQKIVSGLQRAGRRVHVFVGSADALYRFLPAGRHAKPEGISSEHR